jgi:hypothetical protein
MHHRTTVFEMKVAGYASVYKAVVSKGLEVQEIRFANSVEQGSSADLIKILHAAIFPTFYYTRRLVTIFTTVS